MKKIAPFLWFDHDVTEVVDYYCSIFDNCKRSVDELTLDGPAGPWKEAKTVTIAFELDGLELIAFNGGPNHPFNDAISLTVRCKDQAEIDRYWNALVKDGGAEIACGWCKDKFGVRWQIVPHNISALVSHKKAFEAMMHMKKLIVADLEAGAKS